MTRDGILATSGVQLAIPSAKVSNMCRGGAPVPVRRYKRYYVTSVAAEIAKCQNALVRLGVCTAHWAGYGLMEL